MLFSFQSIITATEESLVCMIKTRPLTKENIYSTICNSYSIPNKSLRCEEEIDSTWKD